MLGQSIDTSLSKLKEEGELRRAAERAKLQEAIKALEGRMMKLGSGMLSHLNEEGERHNEAVLAEIERVRKITHKNGSAAEDMAGGLRELTSVL